MDGRQNNWMGLRLATRPIVLAFWFGGRSTRSEVVAFYLLSMVMNAFSFGWEHDDSTQDLCLRALAAAWTIIWYWPWFPLLVRRLHDQSRSGWWSLVSFVPILAATVLILTAGLDGHSGMTVTVPFAGTRHLANSPLVVALALVVASSFLATMALYLWAPSYFPNRYGPNPRVEPDRVSPA